FIMVWVSVADRSFWSWIKSTTILSRLARSASRLFLLIIAISLSLSCLMVPISRCTGSSTQLLQKSTAVDPMLTTHRIISVRLFVNILKEVYAEKNNNENGNQ